MGAKGTQAALEAADVALMTDDLSKIVLARSLAKRAIGRFRKSLLRCWAWSTFLGLQRPFSVGLTIQAAMIHLGPIFSFFLNSVKLLPVPISTHARS